MRTGKGVIAIRNVPKREWDWEVDFFIAAEIQRRKEETRQLRRQEEFAKNLKAARLASAEKELSALIRSMPVSDADCPF